MRKIMLSLVTIIFLAVVGLRNSAKAQVFSPPPEFQKPLPILSEYSGEYADVPNVRDQDSGNFILPTSPEGYERWSTITYRSFQDNNLEIYIANGDGGNPQRLTVNNAVDTYPRLNRGATEIVFSSNRDGNNEIYKMTVDGSNSIRLTNNEFNDTTPVWSPDNAQIAFAAFPDNNWEIMVINADGTGLSARTQDAEIYDDLFPTWSPDGTKIAWTRFDANGGRLYVMDANGGNAHPITDYIPYIQIPAWSPDGTYIAVDGDIDGDYWNEIILVQVNTGIVSEAYDSNGNYVDSWLGGWSPDGKYIIFTRVEYVVINNQLYFNHTYLERIQVNPLSPTAIRVGPIGYELFPDWQSADLLAPTVQVSPVPDFSRAIGFSVNWSGIDPGPANIKSYEVQYQINQDGIWLDWISGTIETSDVFSGNPGDSVQFRSRAIDEAGNLGSWSMGNDITMLFTWNVIGGIVDTRDYPIGLQPVSINPEPVFEPISTLTGNFIAYLRTQGNTILSVIKNGYATPSATNLEIYEDSSYRFVLLPSDNQLENGDFESGTFAGWQTYGQSLPRIDDETYHSGQYGVALGERFVSYFQTEFFFTGTDGTSVDSTDIAIDLNGDLHVVWETSVHASESQIMYKTCSTTKICQPDQVLFAGIDPQIAMDANGQPHLVWRVSSEAGNYINYSHKNANGTWSSPEHVSEVDFETWKGNPDIALSLDNTVHVTWDDDMNIIYYRYKSENGSWQPIEEVKNDGRYPTIATDTTGNIHIAWAPGSVMSTIGYRMRAPNGDWGDITEIVTIYAHERPALALDTSGEVYVGWGDFSSPISYIVRKALDDTWADPIPVPQITDWSGIRLTGGTDGRVFVVWGGQKISYLDQNEQWGPIKTLTGNWPAPDFNGYISVNVASGLNSDQVAIAGVAFDGQFWDNVGVNWLDFPQETSGQTILSQAITIPDDMHKPTLSLLYIAGSETTENGNSIELRVDDGNQVTQLTTFPYIDEWDHLWFDMSTWSGKSITVSFEVSRALDGDYTWLNTDEISLGPWLTPLPISFSPTSIETSTPFSITITGENFIATPTVKIGDTTYSSVQWVNENTLTLQISPGLLPGWYRVWVINPNGQAMVLPGWLSIGKQVYLPYITK